LQHFDLLLDICNEEIGTMNRKSLRTDDDIDDVLSKYADMVYKIALSQAKSSANALIFITLGVLSIQAAQRATRKA